MSSNSKSVPAKRKTVSATTSAAKRVKAGTAAANAAAVRAKKAEPSEIDLDHSDTDEESDTDEQPTAEDLEFIADETDHGLDAETEKQFRDILAALRGGAGRK